MDDTLIRKQLRLGFQAVITAFAVSLVAPAARAAGPAGDDIGDILKRLREGEPTITAELAGLAAALRDDRFVRAALHGCELEWQSDAAFQKNFGPCAKEKAKIWSVLYYYMKKQVSGAPAAGTPAPKAAEFGRQREQAKKLGKHLDLSGGEVAGKLDKFFDGRAGKQPESTGGAPAVPATGRLPRAADGAASPASHRSMKKANVTPAPSNPGAPPTKPGFLQCVNEVLRIAKTNPTAMLSLVSLAGLGALAGFLFGPVGMAAGGIAAPAAAIIGAALGKRFPIRF